MQRPKSEFTVPGSACAGTEVDGEHDDGAVDVERDAPDVPPEPAEVEVRPKRVRCKEHLKDHYHFIPGCDGCQANTRATRHFKGALDRKGSQA